MSLLIKTLSKKDEQFLRQLLDKLGYSSSHIDAEELEDFYFGAEMKKNSSKDVLTAEEAQAYYSRLKKKK